MRPDGKAWGCTITEAYRAYSEGYWGPHNAASRDAAARAAGERLIRKLSTFVFLFLFFFRLALRSPTRWDFIFVEIHPVRILDRYVLGDFGNHGRAF